MSALSEKILEQGLLAVITPANGKQKALGATMAQECLSMLRRICKYAAHFHLIRPLEITVKLPQKSPKVLLPFTTEEQKKLRREITPDEMYQINEALMNSLDLNGGR